MATLLDNSIRKKIEKLGVTKHFREGDVILAESSFIRTIPIVLKGTLRVMRPDEEGRGMLLYYIHPGESCVMSFLGRLHHDTSKVKAVVEEDADILLIPVEKANELARTDPRWNEYIFRGHFARGGFTPAQADGDRKNHHPLPQQNFIYVTIVTDYASTAGIALSFIFT